jgi:hypothetical protein
VLGTPRSTFEESDASAKDSSVRIIPGRIAALYANDWSKLIGVFLILLLVALIQIHRKFVNAV